MKEPFLEPIARKFRFEKALGCITKNYVVVDIGCGHNPHLLNRLANYIKQGVGVDQLIGDKIKGNIKLISCLMSKKIPITMLAVVKSVNTKNIIGKKM